MNELAIKDSLFDWLMGNLGRRHVFTITFNADFVTGNVINASFNALAIPAVTFAVSHNNTMELLRRNIQGSTHIFKAVITGPRQLTVTSQVAILTAIVGPTVTGGASQAIATLLSTVLPLPVTVWFSDQNAPRNIYPYVAVRFLSTQKIGWDEMQDPNINGIANYGGQRSLSVVIDFFDLIDEGIPNELRMTDEAMKVYNSLGNESTKRYFSVSGIAFWDKGTIQNLTEVLETRYEDHVSFDFLLGIAENQEDDVGVIESVIIDGTIDGSEIIAVGPMEIGPT